MLSLEVGDADCPRIALDGINFGLLPTVAGHGRLETRFAGNKEKIAALEKLSGKMLGPQKPWTQDSSP